MAMQTLAFFRSLSPASPRLSPAPVSGGGRSSSSMRGVCTFKCLALSSPSSADDAVKFKEASKYGNLIPLQRRIFSDQLTPVIAYRCLVKEDDREAPSFLYESVEPGFQISTRGRYSVVGAQPALEIVAKGYEVTIVDHEKGHLTEESVDDPMTIPRRISETWKPQLIDDLPDAFCGGWVGYFSYDTVRYKEKKKLAFSSAPHDDRNLADIHLGLYDDVFVFDHVEEKTYAIHWVRLDQYPSVEDAYSDGMKRLDLLVSRVQDIDLLPPGSVDLNTYRFSPALNKSNMMSEEYKKAVLLAKKHILWGDIFQIVLSQRFECRTSADPFEVYRALRHVNPSPYMTYLQAKGCILVASSPEILTRVKQVKGELDDQLTSWDALQSALPVGTVSGAPKLKAMELIDQLEVTRRGPYSGGFGGISYLGDMDIALALRTIIFPTGMHKDANKQREWIAYLQAGAGIVADSNPDDKHQECQNKAAGLARAIDLAESAFVNKSS